MRPYDLIASSLALSLGLGACSQNNAAASVAALETTLTAAETAALHYTTLPPCPQPTPVCSEPDVVAQIKAADATAYNAVQAAEASVRAGNAPDVTGAELAVAALVALVPTATVKGN